MRFGRGTISHTLLLSLLLAVVTGNVLADVPVPHIPKAIKGEQCVEPTEFMRRNHMALLMHQRDKTVHLGIRSKKHSLQGCLNCHAVRDGNAFVSIKSEKHFCNSCHRYAAVSIDCFGCHNSRPSDKSLRDTAMREPSGARP